MAKRLSEISKMVDSASASFLEYLKSEVGEEIYRFLFEMQNQTSVFIFSGIIRNYFLKIRGFRDIDVVLKDRIDIGEMFRYFQVNKNSFGGYKIKINEMFIDLWFVKESWAFKYQKTLDFDLDKYFPTTSFFNFSAISYSLGERRFNYTTHFLRFLRDKKIDLVYKPNFNYSLCVVNSIYYAEKYNLKISDRLLRHIEYLDRVICGDYEKTQLTHFGRIIYENEEIGKKLRSFSLSKTVK
jgi:hypothetical protein